MHILRSNRSGPVASDGDRHYRERSRPARAPRGTPALPNRDRRWWEARTARQKEIDASIAAKADFEYLYDKPYEDRGIVRVAGPFTVESLPPHRTLGVDESDELDHLAETKTDYGEQQDFATMILEHLETSGVLSRRAGKTGFPSPR